MKILMKVENVALTMAQSSQLKQRLSAVLDGKSRCPVARWSVATLFIVASAALPLLASAQTSDGSTHAREKAFLNAAVVYSPVGSAQSQKLEVKHLSGQTFQLVQSAKGFSFDTGRYYFHARARQADGLYRGVTIFGRRKDPMIPEESITAYAAFAHPDKSVANRWILGRVSLISRDEDGAPKKDSVVQRLIIDIT